MKRLAFVLPLLLATAVPAHANLLANGSFEAGTFVGGSYGYPLGQQLFGPSTTISGWTVGGELAWFKTGQANLTAQDGTFAVDLTGFCDLGFNGAGYCGSVPSGGYGTVSQAVATVVGATYRLSFQGGTYGVQSAAPTLVASAGSTSQNFLLPSGAPNTGNWTPYTFNFVATSALTTVSFGGIGGASGSTYYLGVDNAVLDLVSLPVPEPGTAALWLAGAALLVARRRR